MSRLTTRTRTEAEGYVPGWLARQVLALFAEARRRRRRHRLAIGAALLAAALLAGGLVIAGRDGGGSHRAPADRPPGPAHGHAPAVSLPSALVAWFDADGALRIGNVATLAQRPVARLGWQPCCRLVAAGGRIYWAGQSAERDVVQVYDLATREIRTVAPGWAVFASADGRAVYIAQSETRLLLLPADGRGPAFRLVTPPGWRLADPLPLAADGIILSSASRPPGIGLWRPATGTIQVIGHGEPMATWTSASGHSGLIAWLPAPCRRLSCPIEITRTPGGRTLSVPSPVHGGFFLFQGGDAAFSPDGTELAALVSTGPLRADSAPPFLPTLVDTATGTVRLVRRAVLANGELAGWLVWLPSGTRLLAGPASNGAFPGYAIDARTAAARSFSFFPGCCYPGTSPYDITYGALLVGSRWARSGSR
jgi:hypothetical protein